MSDPNWQTDETFLARWLSGSLSENERAAFEASPEFAQFKAIADAGSDLQIPAAYDTSTEYKRLSDTLAQKKQQSAQPKARVISIRPHIRLAVAAVLLIGLLFALRTFFFADITGAKTIIADVGEREMLRLPDETDVVLNAASTLEYDASNWQSSREVTLKGEAFFRVVEGDAFVVKTAAGSVEVLGTSFNVRQRGDAIEVSCYTGRVRVNQQGVSEEITAGQAIIIDGGNLTARSEVPQGLQPDWLNGIIRLRNVSLSNALEELKLHFDLTVSGSVADSLRFTGSFPLNDRDAAIRLILEPFNIPYNYSQANKTLTIGIGNE